jgi:hypothetical protein
LSSAFTTDRRIAFDLYQLHAAILKMSMGAVAFN